MDIELEQEVEFNGHTYKVHFVGTETYKVKHNGQHVRDDECFRLVAWRTKNENPERQEDSEPSSIEASEIPASSKL